MIIGQVPGGCMFGADLAECPATLFVTVIIGLVILILLLFTLTTKY